MKFAVSTVSPPSPLLPRSPAAVRLHSRLLVEAGPVLSPQDCELRQAAYSGRRAAWLVSIGWKGDDGCGND